jgi:hypothetical protein
MNRFISHKLQFGCFAAMLVVGFLMLGFVQSNAQSNAHGPTNPMAQQAAKLGVEAFSFGTFNVAQVLTATEAIAAPIKPLIQDGSANNLQRFRYQYCQSILNDVRNYSIAPEIAAIVGLEKAAKLTGIELPMTQMKTLYQQVTTSW